MTRRKWFSVRSGRERVEADLKVAEEAQRRMLPAEPPFIEGFSMAFRCLPAREVGADLYEYVELEEGRLGIAVGDFSGHGLEAAIQMNFIKGHLLATARRCEHPGDVLTQINDDFRKNRQSKQQFVSMVYGVLDPRSSVFEFAVAGDVQLLWRREGRKQFKKFTENDCGSFPLGFVSNNRFKEKLHRRAIKLRRGDALVFYTDGVPEARHPEGGQFGEERLRTVITDTDGFGATRALEIIFKSIRKFIGVGRLPHDDMTLVVVRVEGE